jgi:hypothetical protein
MSELSFPRPSSTNGYAINGSGSPALEAEMRVALDRAGGAFNPDDWLAFCKDCPEAIAPVRNLQARMRKKLLGDKAWRDVVKARERERGRDDTHTYSKFHLQ